MLEGLVRRRRICFGAIGLLSAAATVLLIAPGLHRDYTLRAFIAGGNDEYRKFVDAMREFTSNELALVAVRSPDALSQRSQRVVADLVDRLSAVPCVQQITAWPRLPAIVRTWLGDQLTRHPLVEGNLISRDGRTMAIVLQMSGENTGDARASVGEHRERAGEGAARSTDHDAHVDDARSPADLRYSAEPPRAGDPQRAGELRRHVVEQLRAIVAQARRENPDLDLIIAGPYVTLIDMYASVDRDLVRFSLAAFALMGVMLGLILRSWRGVLVTVGGGVAAVLCSLALAVVFDFSVALVVQMIVILVMVLTVGNAVQFAVDFEECALAALPSSTGAARADASASACAAPLEPAATMLRRMIAPCSVAMATTMAGFASVCISDLTPIRTFGMLMALGLGLGLVFSLALAPMLKSPHGPRALPEWELRLGENLSRAAAWVARHRTFTITVHVLTTCAAGWGVVRLEFESDFVRNFRPASEVRRSYEFVETNLTPLGAIDVVIRRRDGAKLLSCTTLRLADEFASRAVQECAVVVRKAMTLTDMLRLGESSAPRQEWDLTSRMALANVLLGDDALRNFINDARTAMRVNLRAVEGVSVQEKLRVAEELARLAREVFGDEFDVTVTGLYPFYATLVAQLVHDQYASFVVTGLVIFAVFAVGLRSLRLAVVAMIPNILPVAACIGSMGWFGVPVNMTTVLMLSVVFGLSVDSTSHYLWRCRACFRETGDYDRALRETSRGIGRACVFTGVVVTVGFWILTLSEFLPTAYFGGLTGFTLLWALVADLTLLPALIRAFAAFGPQQPGAEVPSRPA
ncbi:MAG: MMPL family transporter [Phycisphaerales bacterium]|nr:MMPL family transporter [Phycisphaerales bacterium]